MFDSNRRRNFLKLQDFGAGLIHQYKNWYLISSIKTMNTRCPLSCQTTKDIILGHLEILENS